MYDLDGANGENGRTFGVLETVAVLPVGELSTNLFDWAVSIFVSAPVDVKGVVGTLNVVPSSLKQLPTTNLRLLI